MLRNPALYPDPDEFNRKTFIPSVNAAKKRINDVMKRAAYQVHDLITPFHGYHEQYNDPG